MKSLALALPAALLLTTCAAYRAQHHVGAAAAVSSDAKSDAGLKPGATTDAAADDSLVQPKLASLDPLDLRQALLLSDVEKYKEDLKANGRYNCCVKPACTQCALTAGECHCRQVIDANGPCCGECTQAWVEGRGVTEGVDREKVLEHLGCVRELYEKKTPEGMTPPGQKKPD